MYLCQEQPHPPASRCQCPKPLRTSQAPPGDTALRCPKHAQLTPFRSGISFHVASRLASIPTLTLLVHFTTTVIPIPCLPSSLRVISPRTMGKEHLTTSRLLPFLLPPSEDTPLKGETLRASGPLPYYPHPLPNRQSSSTTLTSPRGHSLPVSDPEQLIFLQTPHDGLSRDV